MGYQYEDEGCAISLYGQPDFKRKSWMFTGTANNRSYALHIEDDGGCGHYCRIVGFSPETGEVESVCEHHYKISKLWEMTHVQMLKSIRHAMRRYV